MDFRLYFTEYLLERKIPQTKMKEHKISHNNNIWDNRCWGYTNITKFLVIFYEFLKLNYIFCHKEPLDGGEDLKFGMGRFLE